MDAKLKRAKLAEYFSDSLIRIFLLLTVIVAVFPFVYMFLISFMHTNSMTLTIERLAKADWTLEYYRRLFTGSGNFLIYVGNSSIMAIYTCFVTCLFSTMAAYAFAKKRFFGTRIQFGVRIWWSRAVFYGG